MKKPFKIILIILFSLGLLILFIGIAANSILKSKLENYIAEDLPQTINCSYSNISVNVFNGAASLENPSITFQNADDHKKYSSIHLEEIEFSGVSIWRYLFKNEIHIGKLNIKKPEWTYFKNKKNAPEDSIPNKASSIGNPIFINVLEIDKSKITIYDAEKDSTELFAKNLALRIDKIQVDNKTLSKKIPFDYDKISASGDSLFLKPNNFDNLAMGTFSLDNGNAVLKNITYKTKYSKSQLSKIIAVERDHYDLKLESVTLNQMDFGQVKDEFFFKSKEINLNKPALLIFRDKLIADDLSIKPLYSKMLRDLSIRLTVDSLKINNGYIEYEEKVKEENSGGAVKFKNLDARIANASNTYKSPVKTEIKIRALFMEQAPITLQWNFDVQNQTDNFIFKGEVGTLEAERMNQFTEPNLKVRLQGVANQTYFTTDGNNDTSRTDLKIKFSDFKVSILQKDEEKKNKFLSAVVNIFISKNSDKNEDEFNEASAEATRNKTKSIFNFLWIGLKNALQKTMT